MLAAAIAGVVFPITGSGAHAGCLVNGATENCTGDLTGGVQLNNGGGPITTLNVLGLTTDIAPLQGLNGIGFSSDGPVVLNVATGPWGIFTTDAAGIFAESTTGNVDVAAFATITTDGSGSGGISAFAASNLNIVFGGSITTNGTGSVGINANADGAVTITSFGQITATGRDSFGVRALSNTGDITIKSFGNLSISGIDGIGIFAESNLGDVTIQSAGEIFLSSPTSVLGGAAIFALSGNTAKVDSRSNIHTVADGVAGIAAEGDVDASVTSRGSIFTEGDQATAITVRAFNGDATVHSSGDIRTEGAFSPAIDVMSVIGAVAVEARGRITATGDDSDGILARGGTTVAIESRANISATGNGSAAIRAWAGDSIEIWNYGTALGGLCACSAGIDMLSFNPNATNTLINFGSISALSGLAIQSEVADPSSTSVVDNYGTVTGDVVLWDGTAAAGTFNNHVGGLFNPGANVTANLVTNDGTIAPGGRGSVLPSGTFMSDDFAQGAGGIYAVDLDPTASIDRSDLIIVSNTAQLSGNVEVQLLSLPASAVDSFLILQAMGGLTDPRLGLIASPALHATLTTDATDVQLGIAVDFRADGLNPNQRAIATNLMSIYVAGAGGVSPVLLGLLNVDDLAAYKTALDQLSPEIYSNAEMAALYSSLAFSNSLLSCKVNGADTASIIREGQCLWAGASARFLDSGTTSNQIGFNETAGLFTAGMQVALDNVWRLGVASGFQSSTLHTATGASSDGSMGQAGVALKYNPGPLLLAAAVAGGGATYDTRRIMSFGGFTGVAESDQTLGIFSGALRAAYILGSPHLYAKPVLDMSVTQLQLGSFTETGSAAALAVEGGGQTVFAAAPSVEVGTELWLANGTLIRPLIRLGGVFYAGDDFALTAGVADLAPFSVPGGSGFTITTDLDDAMGLVGAGLEVINGNDAALRLSYDGQLGATTQIHAVGIKGSARF